MTFALSYSCKMSYVNFLNSLIGAVSLAHSEIYDIVLVSARSIYMRYAHSTRPLNYPTLEKCRMSLFSIRWLVQCHVLIERHPTFCLCRLDQATWPMHYLTLAKCRMSLFSIRWLEQCPLLIVRHPTFCLCKLDHGTWDNITQYDLCTIVLLQNDVCLISQFADWSSVT